MADYLERVDEAIAAILAELRFPRGWSKDKKMAVESYIRNYLKRLTLPELEIDLKLLYDDTGKYLIPDLQYKLDKASKGYDAFMAKRAGGIRPDLRGKVTA